jgi:hypothetical protein
MQPLSYSHYPLTGIWRQEAIVVRVDSLLGFEDV